MKMQEAALIGPLRIRFYDSVGNGIPVCVATATGRHTVPRIGTEADPYKNVCKPSLRVHFHGKTSIDLAMKAFYYHHQNDLLGESR
jgi:hypothetical protein